MRLGISFKFESAEKKVYLSRWSLRTDWIQHYIKERDQYFSLRNMIYYSLFEFFQNPTWLLSPVLIEIFEPGTKAAPLIAYNSSQAWKLL